MGIRTINWRLARWLIAMAGAVLLLSIFGAQARADVTVTVNTTSDDTTAGNGTCSLREAITYADGTAEADCAAGTASGTTTISLPAGHYVLSGGELAVTGPTVITGSGSSNTVIDANGTSRVLNIGTTQVTLNGVTVTGGQSSAPLSLHLCGIFLLCFSPVNGNPGGGILNQGTLTITNSAITGNDAGNGTSGSGNDSAGENGGAGGSGGGIYSTLTLTISNSTITANKAGAGAAGNTGASSSTAAGGAGGNGGAGGSGGGIDQAGGTVTITDSMVSGNSSGRGGDGGTGGTTTAAGFAGGVGGTAGAASGGGGIENAGNLSVSRSTFSANTTGGGGRGGNGGPGTTSGGAAGGGGAGGPGGAIDSSTQDVLQNATLTGNVAATGGAAGTPGSGGASAAAGTAGAGGALNQTAASGALTQSTVASNSAAGLGGGLEQSGTGAISFTNSIIASNHTGSSASNCGGAMITAQGTNILFGDNTCGTAGGDPRLQPLADNGGPVQTMALGSGSSAVNVVPTNDCLATDARGVARPQGSTCDAGAYELAAASVSGVSASANSTSTASVIASINPNFKDTTVLVRYGTTTAYGSTTPAQDLGSANSGTSFSARLSNLTPGTSYHAQVVATNADGTSTSGDVTFTTLTPVSATLAAASVSANKLAVTIVCDHGNPSDLCSGPVTVTSQVTSAGGKPVAITAAKKKPKPAKRTTKRVTVASSRYSVSTGHRTTITLALNKRGRALLNARYKVPATVKVGGTTSATRTVTFSYGRVRSGVGYTWKFFRSYTVAELLTVTALPDRAKVTLSCHGGGCPFAKKTFALKRKAKSRSLALAAKLKQAHLRPHTTVRVAITAANAVGKVVTFTMVANDDPRVASACLVPGARTPSACATK